MPFAKPLARYPSAFSEPRYGVPKLISARASMDGDSKSGPQLATYARFNVLLEPGWMKTELEIKQTLDKLGKIAEMDDPTNMDELVKIGQIAAAKQIKPEHFPTFFDIA